MSDDTRRSVSLTRLSRGRYEATNARGGTLVVGQGGEDFTPVELLLTAIAGCSAIDVDYLTSRRAEPVRFELTMAGDKTRSSAGNRMVDLTLTFDVTFPPDASGDGAREVLPRAVQASHDRLCTVSRTVEQGTPIAVRIAGSAGE